MAEELQTIAVNAVGTSRKELRNGREYIVTNITSIVPGVLPGSKGPLLYTLNELSKNYDSWNGMPIVWNHPTINGMPTTARHPDILEKFGLGYIYNTKVDGKLTHEGWFDVESIKRIDDRILTKLESNEKIEQSTGLYLRQIAADEGATFNGKNYSYTAVDYKPDHLAILIDGIGACSINDGCGVNNSSKEVSKVELTEELKTTIWEKLSRLLGFTNTSTITNSNSSNIIPINEEAQVEKNQLIDWLVTNCDCWKEAGDKDTLNKMSDAKLKTLKDKVEQAKRVEEVANAAKQGFENGDRVHTYNESTKAWDSKEKVKVVVAPVVNDNQANRLTAEEQEDLAFARAEKNRQKGLLVNQLVTNLTDVTAKAQAVTVLNTKSLDELKLLVSLQAPVINQNTPSYTQPTSLFGQANYGGASVPNTNQSTNQDDDVLPMPIMNWKEDSKAGLAN